MDAMVVVTISIQLAVHKPRVTSRKQFLKMSSISETNVSEILEHLKEMFLQYYMQSGIYRRLKSLITQYFVTRSEKDSKCFRFILRSLTFSMDADCVFFIKSKSSI